LKGLPAHWRKELDQPGHRMDRHALRAIVNGAVHGDSALVSADQLMTASRRDHPPMRVSAQPRAARDTCPACFPGREAVFGTPAGADDRAAALVPPPAHPLGDPRRHPRGLHLRHHGALPRPSWGTVMCSGRMPSFACSRSVICRSRFLPSLVLMILSCSLRIESISISGRGGQPGR